MKKTFVLGLGISGLAAVRFLQAKGDRVWGADRKKPRETVPDLTVVLETEEIDLTGFSLFVLSPGVAPDHPLVLQARHKGIEVIGEAELALRAIAQPAVAVTGTNGKTTVTLLTEHILRCAGLRARALGNVGDPLSGYVLQSDPSEILVIELSSYQLETLEARVFDAAVLLNVTPDHLDRYGTMDAYAQAKCRLQPCVKEGGSCVVQTEVVREWGKWLLPGIKTFGNHPDSQLWTDKVVAKYSGKVEYFLPESYKQLGMHESVNALAAWALCRPFGIEAEVFIAALQTFKKPSHRIEPVAEINGVGYFDDSKGTNIDAVIRAVEAMRGSVVLIVGGVDKGASYLPWKEHLKGKVKRMVAIGQAAEKIEQELSSAFPFERASSLEEAVVRAKGHAEEGDSVLLSPGCASFDMFRDYVQRGEEFQRVVLSLKGGEKS